MPVPTAGAGVLLSPSVPNPVQFNFAAGTVVSSAQQNSNNYGHVSNILTLINQLNATGTTGYACASCFTTIVNGTGVTSSLGAQISGVGVALTIGLAHGDYLDTSSTPQTKTGSIITSGNLVANSGVLAYPSTFSSPGGAAGDAVFQRGSSTGALFLGGGASNAFIDYGVSTAGTLTINKPLNVAGTGAFAGNVAAQGGGVLAYPSTFSNPGGAAGDAVFQRSSSSGALYLGGAAVAGLLDFSVYTGGTFALRRSDNSHFVPLLVGSDASAGSSVGAYVPPVYGPAGAALGSTTRIVALTLVVANGAVTGTATLSGAAAETYIPAVATVGYASSISIGSYDLSKYVVYCINIGGTVTVQLNAASSAVNGTPVTVLLIGA